MGQKSSRFLFVAASRNGNAGRYDDVCKSIWFAKNKYEYSQYVVEDALIRSVFEKIKMSCLISAINISRDVSGNIDVLVKSAKISSIVGKDDIVPSLKKSIKKLIGKDVNLSVRSIKNSEVNATVVSYIIAAAISSGRSYKKSIKLAIDSAMKNGAIGIKVLISGRLNGVDIARSEKFAEGSIPLHTIRADIDYNHVQADTKYGVIGVKVWINRR